MEQSKQVITMEFELLEGEFGTAGEASSKIKRVLQQIGVSADVIRRIAIASYEGEMNVIIHAQKGTIATTISPESTRIVIADEGPGIPDVKKAMEAGYSTAPDHIREMGFGAGMGLPNMSRCADQFQIETQVGKGTTIIMLFNH